MKTDGKFDIRFPIPFLGIVFLILLVLKIMEVGIMPTVSWWWVFAPLLVPLGILLGVGLAILIVSLIGLMINN